MAKEIRFRRMAECTNTGERVEDPEYVNGKPYSRSSAQFMRDARHNAKLRRKQAGIDRVMQAASVGYAKES